MKDLYEMESFLSLGTNPPFQNCKDALIGGKDNSWAFVGSSNQLNSYQSISGRSGSGIQSVVDQSGKSSIQVFQLLHIKFEIKI